MLPHRRELGEQPQANSRQTVISQIMSSVERTRIDTERDFLDVIDKVDEIEKQQAIIAEAIAELRRL